MTRFPLSAPFLKRVTLLAGRIKMGAFPFDCLPYLNAEFALDPTSPITFLADPAKAMRDLFSDD